MRPGLVAALALAASGAGVGPALAAPPTVQMMVVGRSSTLLSARSVTLPAATIKIAATRDQPRRRCRAPSGTAIAGLLAARLSVGVTDSSGCDPSAMFVARVGRESNRGAAGWEYKVDRRSPLYGAGDPGGRLRAGARLLWFWCLRASACQRTLEVSPTSPTPAAGGPLTVRVVGYDDNGHGRAIAGATIHLGPVTAVSAADGRASLTTPATPGRYPLLARKRGLVPSFPVRVSVG